MAPRPRREAGRQGSDKRQFPATAEEPGQAHQLDRAEHDRLLQAAFQGDREAREALIKAHLDWVAAAARERSARGLAEGDLFQEGIIGLIEAIEGFRASGRLEFEAFARERVAISMDAALGNEERVVRNGRLLVQAADDYVTAEMTLRRELGRDSTIVELAEKLEWSVQRTEEIGQIVADARRRHDEELLQYLEPGDIDLEQLPEEHRERNGG
jgi:RNA polymerase sigma factor (sigma-70 family)